MVSNTPQTVGQKAIAAGGCELRALAELSTFLGRQKLLVQASTGNTSIKIGSTLWIKASGKWLANAAAEEVFVPVDRAEASRYMSGTLPDSTNGSGLKPSIETAMHLILPHRVVVHIHSISAIAWAVQRKGADLVHERMGAFRWSWIPYASSGGPLAAKMRAELQSSPNVFILANHGLVVGADSCEEAKQRLQEVEERLAIAARPVPEPDLASLEQLARASNLKLPDTELIHSLATDEFSTALVSRGILYPCQAIFLGRQTAVFEHRDFLLRFPKEYQNENGFRQPAVLIKGRGALVAKDLTRSESEMLIGLSQVARRLGSDAQIAYLSERNVDELLDNCVYGDAQPSLKLTASAASARCDDSSKTA
jgi:rhamnose utilization protein RhaD (predicted bifunctional aldolase and dehydrogenase)